MAIRPVVPQIRFALLLLGLFAALPGRIAWTDGAARTPAETYERKSSIRDCLVHVAADLAARQKALALPGPAQLVIVLDTTSSMNNEVAAIRAALAEMWEAGPPGLEVGVYGVLAQGPLMPTRIPGRVESALERFAFIPEDGPRNILAEVRAALPLLAKDVRGPRAVLLVSEEAGEAEDDVEATRDALYTADAAFYAIAAEAAFERAWNQPFAPRDCPKQQLTERYDPAPRRMERGTLFFGGDAAFGLVPYLWEGGLAQTEFHWVRPPSYPVPSGFGYWSLGSLANSSGGRYFVFDFPRGVVTDAAQAKRTTLYDYGRLSLLAPDLRPRAKILKDLARDPRCTTILRIWEHLANDALPILRDAATLERRGASVVTRPTRRIDGGQVQGLWYTGMDDVARARKRVAERHAAVETALSWWEGTQAKGPPPRTGPLDPLSERLEANFQLMGVQLRKVECSWRDALLAIDSIEPLDLSHRQVRIVPRPIHFGTRLPAKPLERGDEKLDARLAELLLMQSRFAERYAGTPWALLLEKGWIVGWQKDVQLLEDERRPKPTPSRKQEEPAPELPPQPPPPPPAPGPKPGSGGAGPTTGG